MTLYGSTFQEDHADVPGMKVSADGLSRPAVVHSDGMTFFGNDGMKVTSCFYLVLSCLLVWLLVWLFAMVTRLSCNIY